MLKRNKKNIRIEEYFDRDGRWMRDFKVRSDSWSLIENWASETKFRLIALKGKKRIYRRGDADFYQTFLEIRHEEGRVVFTSWISVGRKLRWMSLFYLPALLAIDPKGFKGIQTRRSACKDLNTLLDRLKQPEIIKSKGLHWADLSLPTLILFFSMMGFTSLAICKLFFKFELKQGLSALYIKTVIGQTSPIFLVAALLALGYQFGLLRILDEAWKRNLTAFSLFIVFSLSSVFWMSKTHEQVTDEKFFYTCFSKSSSNACLDILASYNSKDRERIMKKLEEMQKGLSLKTN